MTRAAALAAALAALGVAGGAAAAQDPPRRAVIVDEADTVVEEAPPHGAIGMSTAYRISDAAEGGTLAFRKRVLHLGAAVGVHRIAHDEVYYVLSGEGEVTSDGKSWRLTPGMAAYLWDGAEVGIRQTGDAPLSLIIAYPVAAAAPAH